MATLTKAQLEQKLAAAYGCSVDELATRHRLAVVPCDCGEESCHGWIAAEIDDAEEQEPD